MTSILPAQSRAGIRDALTFSSLATRPANLSITHIINLAVASGFKNAARLPSWSARDSQAATQ